VLNRFDQRNCILNAAIAAAPLAAASANLPTVEEEGLSKRRISACEGSEIRRKFEDSAQPIRSSDAASAAESLAAASTNL
jgi:hypothetical protein